MDAKVLSTLQDPSKWTQEVMVSYNKVVQTLTELTRSSSLSEAKRQKEIQKHATLLGPFLVKVPQLIVKGLSCKANCPTIPENSPLWIDFVLQIGCHAVKMLHFLRSYLKFKPFDVEKICYNITLKLFEMKQFSAAEEMCRQTLVAFLPESMEGKTSEMKTPNSKENLRNSENTENGHTVLAVNQKSKCISVSHLIEHHALVFGSVICLASCVAERAFEVLEMCGICDTILPSLEILSKEQTEAFKKYLENLSKALSRAIFKSDASIEKSSGPLRMRLARLKLLIDGHKTVMPLSTLNQDIIPKCFGAFSEDMERDIINCLRHHASSLKPSFFSPLSEEEQQFVLAVLQIDSAFSRFGQAVQRNSLHQLVPLIAWAQKCNGVKSLIEIENASRGLTGICLIGKVRESICWIDAEVSLDKTDGLYFGDHYAPLLLLQLLKKLDHLRKQTKIAAKNIEEKQIWVHFLVLTVKLALWVRTYIDPLPEQTIKMIFESPNHLKLVVSENLQSCAQACVELYITLRLSDPSSTPSNFANMGFMFLLHWLDYVKKDKTSLKEIRWLASSFYNFGAQLYNNGSYAECIPALSQACLLYEIWNRSEESDVTQNQLARRYSLLANACFQSQRYTDAIKFAGCSLIHSKVQGVLVDVKSKSMDDGMKDIVCRSLIDFTTKSPQNPPFEVISSLCEHLATISDKSMAIGVLFDLLEQLVWMHSVKRALELDKVRSDFFSVLYTIVEQNDSFVPKIRYYLLKAHYEKYVRMDHRNQVVTTLLARIRELLETPNRRSKVDDENGLFLFLLNCMELCPTQVYDMSEWQDGDWKSDQDSLTYEEIIESISLGSLNQSIATLHAILHSSSGVLGCSTLENWWRLIEFQFDNICYLALFHGCPDICYELSQCYHSIAESREKQNCLLKALSFRLLAATTIGLKSESHEIASKIKQIDTWNDCDLSQRAILDHLTTIESESTDTSYDSDNETQAFPAKRFAHDLWKSIITGLSRSRSLCTLGRVDESGEIATESLKSLLGLLGSGMEFGMSCKTFVGISHERNFKVLPISKVAFQMAFLDGIRLIGRIHELKGHTSECLQYYKYGLDISLRNGNHHEATLFTLRIANTYRRMHQFAAATFFIRKSLCTYSFQKYAPISTRVRPFEVCQLFILLRAGDLLRDQNHGRTAISFYDHAAKIVESHTSNQTKSLEAPQRTNQVPKNSRKTVKGTPPTIWQSLHLGFSSMLARIYWHKASALWSMNELQSASQVLDDAMVIPADVLTKNFVAYYRTLVELNGLLSKGIISDLWSPYFSHVSGATIQKKSYRGTKSAKAICPPQSNTDAMKLQLIQLRQSFQPYCVPKIMCTITKCISYLYGQADPASCTYFQLSSLFLGIQTESSERQQLSELTLPVWKYDDLDEVQRGFSDISFKEDEEASLEGNSHSDDESNSTIFTSIRQNTPKPNPKAPQLDNSLEISQIRKLLPIDWTVCCITLSADRTGLIVSRFSNQDPPFVSATKFLDGEFTYRQISERFDKIMQESRDTIKGTLPIDCEETKSVWWRKRTEQNNALKELLNDMENNWLGVWKGILLGRPVHGEQDAYIDRLTNLPDRDPGLLQRVASYLRVFREGATAFTEEQLSYASAFIGASGIITDEEARSYIQPINSVSQASKSATVKPRRRVGARASGEIEEETPHKRNERLELSFLGHGPVILMLDEELQKYPWESLPLLDLKSQAITRCPSLSLLKSLLLRKAWVYPAPRQVGYVLDPAGDLPRTRQHFQDIFRGQQDWRGFIGQEPSPKDCREILETCDAYIYCGHNGGEQYLSRQGMRGLTRCCPTVLIGCSSGALKVAGDMEPRGAVLDYLSAGW
eukprot:TRINITY_DN7063_c0_g1_i1.p1 TRINITY_DN7063_c0_g1~~TRINITY_DN7063_c0_g1_i1.p1  ORF type:complete len:1850 (-),score=285.78 TRINITY_DN7063_c0_g1_i1:71-5620(-)